MMKTSRQFRFLAALIVLFSMLFTQLAVASYACPNMRSGPAGGTGAMAATASAEMPGCTGMDKEQPSLCHALDQVGKQSLDKPGVPHVESFIPGSMLQAIIFIDAIYRPQPSQPRPKYLTRVTAPPLSIRNCCFRI